MIRKTSKSQQTGKYPDCCRYSGNATVMKQVTSLLLQINASVLPVRLLSYEGNSEERYSLGHIKRAASSEKVSLNIHKMAILRS